ncbi:MAG: hypothetical protein EA397_05425 [Deltaproteobacteria bacterium]|nr:MAG: hypothetical protein EA397_05425 [Deltaproteobacteria bacterium]
MPIRAIRRLFRRGGSNNQAESTSSQSSTSDREEDAQIANSEVEIPVAERGSETPILDQAEHDVVGPMPAEDEDLLFDPVQPERTERRAEHRAGDVVEVDLDEGSVYVVTSEDMARGAEGAWNQIARDHGMSGDKLRVFNQHIIEVNDGMGSETQFTEETELKEGAEIYIPSTQELLLAECRAQAGSFDEALALYGEIADSSSLTLLEAARDRSSGVVGEAYGTRGVDGAFYTPNPQVNGASSRRSEQINGQTEYRVVWAPSFWKCSVFLQDVVFQSGFQPHMLGNNHYLLAGRMQDSPLFDEIDVAQARPGDCWQRFGGTQSNQSHVAVLTSFVRKTPKSDDVETWSMDILGAESDRSAESTRDHDVKVGTNETTDGRRIRFFRPNTTR